MAGHARLRGRNAGKRGLLDRCVAIAAVNSQLPGVVLVAEGHGLVPGDVDIGDVRREVHGVDRVSQRGDDEHGAVDGHPGHHVGAAFEYLWHRILTPYRLLFLPRPFGGSTCASRKWKSSANSG